MAQNDRIVLKVLVLDVADLDTISSTLYDPLRPTGEIQ